LIERLFESDNSTALQEPVQLIREGLLIQMETHVTCRLFANGNDIMVRQHHDRRPAPTFHEPNQARPNRGSLDYALPAFRH
jgi:hypothetical protein